ncbi:MAG: transglutaminaseTgpA domain-containing protein [Haloarculaceae archaeon]
MSTEPGTRSAGGANDAGTGRSGLLGGLSLGVDPLRVLSVAGVVLLLAAPLSVLWFVSNVAGDPTVLAAVIAGSLLAATVFARFLPLVPAATVAVAMLLGGGYLYVMTLPFGIDVLVARATFLQDTVSLLTGLSVLRIVNAGVWAQAAAPAPTFLAWYLALRRRYVGAVVVGGATLGLFVLTGDAVPTTVLFGVVGAAAAVGFGDLSARGAAPSAADAVAVVVAAMIAVSLTLSVIPAVAGGGGGGSGPVLPGEGGGGATVEASLINAGDDIGILGAIELSPEVRFTVTSEARSYWRVGSYDRYTGQGWVRTGSDRPLEGTLPRPPGRSRPVVQTFEAETDLTIMPAAWRPRGVRSSDVGVRVTAEGGLQPDGSLSEGDRYTVESRVVAASPEELRGAGTDYPERIAGRYTQLPANQPERVAERTARITANAENPYDTARVVEQWLENNREYSLEVDRPDGNIADAFLFEMDAGYCTYYATTMVSMLRTQDVPARLVVGYTPGERVARDTWVARGLDSHAWVEVYFPEVGWVRFDPTPAGPREEAERGRIEDARESGTSEVDIPETANNTYTPTPEAPDFETPAGAPTGATPGDRSQLSPGVENPFDEDGGGAGATTTGGSGGIPVPDLSREQVGFGLVVFVGAAAAARRTGLTERAYREVWLRYQPRTDPKRDVERAFERLEYVAAQRGRPRRPGETPRQFLADVRDRRADRLGELYERARYAGEVTEAEADEAVELADGLVSDRPGVR